MKLLELNGVCKKYKSFELKNVSFSVESGQIVGFIGRNGAGKTTTLKAIMNLISIDKGLVFAFGKDFKQNELELKNRIGFALSEINYYPDSPVKTLTRVVSKFYKNFSNERYNSLLAKFGIDENKKIKQLSSGMKVKYQVLLALSSGAELLILDEPTSGLDPFSRNEVVEIFQDFVQDKNRAILFSTHITSDLEKCADNIVYINSGEIRYEGSIKDFVDSYALVNANESDVSTEALNKFVSHRVHAGKVEGLLRKEDALNIGMPISQPSLEDVMVYLERGKV